MTETKKWNILYIKDEKTVLKTDVQIFTELFNKADIAPDRHKALKLIFANDYDMLGFGRMRQWPFTIPIEVRQVVPNHARGDLRDIVLSEIADQTIF